MGKRLWRGVPIFALAAALSNAEAWAEPLAFPSAGTVPANLLRIQVRMESPLPYAPGIDAFRLDDPSGAPIVDPFYDIPVLSQDGLVVSLLLHPGRVKTGVAPNLEVGPALWTGQVVTLRGAGPMAGLSQTWRIGPPLMTAIDAATWDLSRPRQGSRLPFVVRFNRPLDANAAAYLAIADASGARLRGEAAFIEGEQAWRFIPERPWGTGRYALRAHANLEDVAGNRLCAPFEAPGLSRLDCDDASIGWTPSP